MSDQSDGRADHPVTSSEAVESAAHTARVCTRCEYIKETWPDGEVNERYPYVGFWERFTSSLEERWQLIKSDHEQKQTHENTEASGQARLVTDGGEELDGEVDREVREAQDFWSKYEIPFEYGTAIKVRKSGLSRGSWGDGRAADTVIHLHVQEPFTDGRLSRSADSYLCEPDSYVTEQAQEPPVADGVEQKVTCDTCRKRMERWYPVLQEALDDE